MLSAKSPLRRPYQQTVMSQFAKGPERLWALLWERQAGKSTTFADFALYEMLRQPDRTVIYGSASLLLAQEITLKTAIRANQSVSQLIESDAHTLKQFADSAQSTIDQQAQKPALKEAVRLHLIKLYEEHREKYPDAADRNPQCFPECIEPLNQSAGCRFKKSDGDSPSPGGEGRGEGKLINNRVCEALINRRERVGFPARSDFSTFPPLPRSKNRAAKVQFKTYDASTGKELIGGRGASAKNISAASFAELFSQQRLEFRVYHSATSYSRTKVIAPNIATARSWSGTVLLDEVAFIRNLRELMTALLPVISTDKQFKLIVSTTPPEFNDTHYSFELLAPPPEIKFQSNAEGNWYTSESGIRVHRADAFDTALAGKKIFDLKTGAEITPQEAFTRAPNKDGHRIAHWLTWMLGGSAACDLLRLRTAQERGSGDATTGVLCQNFQINSDADMVTALNWLSENLGGVAASRQSAANQSLNSQINSDTLNLTRTSLRRSIETPLRIGLGFDVATTTKGKSNPSVLSIMEEHGPEWIIRARFVWKIKDPEVANSRLGAILDTLERCGIRPRALAQDATNERYYAEQNRTLFRRRVPVILVVASQAVDKPGLDKPTNWKEYLGNQLVAKLDDNNLTLPPDEYTRTDYRLEMKDRGKFVCEPNDQGMHGDCFDADKLAGHALSATSSRRTIFPPLEIMRQWAAEESRPGGLG